MKDRIKKPLVVLLGLVALAAGGAGVAQGVGGDDDDGREANEQADGGNLHGDSLKRAERSALATAGGGEVIEAEKGDDSDGAYEVAVRKRDGSVVEYHLDSNFKVIGTEKE
jgi:uncharacterized membrane protein YkoI